jgi:hypothetical protein
MRWYCHGYKNACKLVPVPKFPSTTNRDLGTCRHCLGVTLTIIVELRNAFPFQETLYCRSSGKYLLSSSPLPNSYENTFRRSEQAAPRSLCGPGVPAA